jgi:predicted acylesterase/phospholipase RssA
MTIKNLVISGGGPIMIQILGAVQQLEENNFIDMKTIETIYGTSAGAIVGVLICLKYDWETINDYIIKRPWQEVFTIKVENILDAYTKKGIFDKNIIEKCFKPLLNAKDISLDITLEEFYEYCKIELHMFSFEINEFKVQDISYLTHPKLTLLNAIQMTCAIPVLVTPVCIDDKCFIDGGMSTNYPLSYCIASGKPSNEILGFKNKYNDNKNYIHSESTLLDFLLNFLFKTIFSLNTDNNQPSIQYELICEANFMTLDNLRSALSNIDIRKELLQNGIDTAKTFLNIHTNIHTNLENGV